VLSEPNTNPKPPENASGSAEQHEGGTGQPDAKAAVPGSKIHEPKSSAECCKPNGNDRHWLDYATGLFAFIAAVGGIAAAIAGGYQGWVSRDSEQRSLRAYVFAENTNIGITDDRNPNITVTIKNVGSTPAYEFRHWACAFVRPTPNPVISWNVFPNISKGIEAPATIVAPQGVKLKIIDGWCESPFQISDAQRSQIKRGIESVYVVGVIT
jgi:hypothetical protein